MPEEYELTIKLTPEQAQKFRELQQSLSDAVTKLFRSMTGIDVELSWEGVSHRFIATSGDEDEQAVCDMVARFMDLHSQAQSAKRESTMVNGQPQDNRDTAENE